MRFTYQAPVEYNDLTSGLRTVESRYQGPHDFKIYVDRKTHLLTHGVEYDHDGHPILHGGIDESDDQSFLVYLHSHNPNHICLMAMICNHEEHEAPNVVETVCEKYNMVYQRHEPMDLLHTFDFRKTKINEKGVVTYAWWQMVITWEMLVRQGISHKNTINTRLQKDVLTKEQREKAAYCIEIIDYVIDNEISMKHPWKIAWPDIDTVSLDNSIPIGLGGGTVPDEHWLPIEEQPYYKTNIWGSCAHENADRPEGSGLLRSKNPMTPAEAALVEGALVYDEALAYNWCNERLCDEHPSHCHVVDQYQIVQENLIKDNPDIELTAELVRLAHANHIAVCEANGDHTHRKCIPSDESNPTV
jgi:hypothetical protein